MKSLYSATSNEGGKNANCESQAEFEKRYQESIENQSVFWERRQTF